jgi:hypothetical protein
MESETLFIFVLKNACESGLLDKRYKMRMKNDRTVSELLECEKRLSYMSENDIRVTLFEGF